VYIIATLYIYIYHRIIEWFGVAKNFKDHLVPAPLPWAGTPTTGPGFSMPHPTWHEL